MFYNISFKSVALAGIAACSMLCALPSSASSASSAAGELRAGASVIDISPAKFPTYSSGGGFVDGTTYAMRDALHSRCIVIDDGRERIAIVVLDLVSFLRDFADEVKTAASAMTGIAADHILIAATHTHTAPNVRSRAGLQIDQDYIRLLVDRIPLGIAQAAQNMRPARVGWSVIQDPEHTHPRRWIRRPDKTDVDPLGAPTVRANMHPGFQNPDVIGPSGPTDPSISILAFQSLDGRPIAVLANYGQHYYGVPALVDGSVLLSADYYGAFAEKLGALIASSAKPASGGGFGSSWYQVDYLAQRAASNPQKKIPVMSNDTNRVAPFVAIMAQGASGDQQWMDYSKPAAGPGLEGYADSIAHKVFEAYRAIDYHDWVPVKMAEMEFTVGTRVPDAEEVQRAREVVVSMDGRAPRTVSESYAASVMQAAELPKAEEVKLQAIAIGDLAFAALPNEVYAITGLKIKAQSPFPITAVMALANGGNGYLPPPEQYLLGGYTTWRWPHYLEPQAEPKMLDAALRLLETVARRPRQKPVEPMGIYDKDLLAGKPVAYWRLNEFNGPMAHDAAGLGHEAQYENGIAFYLTGPESDAFAEDGFINRAPHFAGGRLSASLDVPRDSYSVEFWFWSGMPADVRGITGWLLSTGAGDAVGIGGSSESPGRLFLASGGRKIKAGGTPLAPKTWHHLALVRSPTQVNIYLDGGDRPEISVPTKRGGGSSRSAFVFGGQVNPADSFEGKLDNIAVYDRPLSPLEISDRFRLSGMNRGD